MPGIEENDYSCRRCESGGFHLCRIAIALSLSEQLICSVPMSRKLNVLWSRLRSDRTESSKLAVVTINTRRSALFGCHGSGCGGLILVAP
jgi:hypothetical protein